MNGDLRLLKRQMVSWVGRHITFQKDILTSLKSIRKLLQNANFFPGVVINYVCKKKMYVPDLVWDSLLSELPF